MIEPGADARPVDGAPPRGDGPPAEALGDAGGPDRLSCEEVFRRLDDYVDRELNPDERARVESHLATCAECAGEYRFEASVLRGVRDKLDSLRMPSRLIADLRARLNAEAEESDA